jgi:PIN domain nuclease of toxin-antitoxin system
LRDCYQGCAATQKFPRRHRRLVDAADAAGLKHLSFVAAHAVHVARLPRHHPDPFDRALIAQAILEPLTLLTHDATLARYGNAVRLV